MLFHLKISKLSDVLTNASLFRLNPAILISGQPISENSSDCPYYPLGSEASSMRPFTPNVRGEEVSSNYEPVLITNRGFAVSPVPPTPNPTPSTLRVKDKTFIIFRRDLVLDRLWIKVPQLTCICHSEHLNV